MRPLRTCPSLVELPVAVTIAQAAALLGVSRGTVYALVKRWQDTDGREGLPAYPVGRALRVPKAALAERLGSYTFSRNL